MAASRLSRVPPMESRAGFVVEVLPEGEEEEEAAVAAVLGLSRSSRRDTKRWRMTGMEAAMMVTEGSTKPQITRGRALSAGGC